MNLATRQSLVRTLAKSYRGSDRKTKGKLIDQLVAITGYHRTHASYLLNHPPQATEKSQKRVRQSEYRKVLPTLRKLWKLSNHSCGKRLVGVLPSYIETLTRDGELLISEEDKKLLLETSAATIDRLLESSRARKGRRGRSATKPGTLLRSQIPIQVYTPWDDRKPGFVEVDLVAHCGTSVEGEFAYTLDVTDLELGWSEQCTFLGRSQIRTLKAMNTIRRRFPVPILGIDSDNDSVFINWHFYRWCKREEITFTRCRSYHKNDQAHIEEKNWSIVRRYVGYQRFETQKQVDLLNQLYDYLRLYFNFFQATMKLERKERVGSKVRRVYGKSKTPYQRILDHPDIAQENKDKLTALYQNLNPAQLLDQIDKITARLVMS